MDGGTVASESQTMPETRKERKVDKRLDGGGDRNIK